METGDAAKRCVRPPTPFGNRGDAFETMLCALLSDLVRAGEPDFEPRGRESARARAVAPRSVIEINVALGRSALTVEIVSDRERPPPGSWRTLLAAELAATLDAIVSPHPETPGYVIQFR